MAKVLARHDRGETGGIEVVVDGEGVACLSRPYEMGF